MSYKSKKQKLLFVINQSSGNQERDYGKAIMSFFKDTETNIELFLLPKNCASKQIQVAINNAKADRVIAVGGDGTLKLVAECLINRKTPIGIIPAGSANGMAKELGIPLDIGEALEVAAGGTPQQIHVTRINNELCIHLSDIGFNAYLVKKFDELPQRGMWTYARAAWQAFWIHRKMDVQLQMEDQKIHTKAAMIVIANATEYGTGLQISPDGKLDDELFEVILIKEYSVMEILKIWISKLPWDPKKIERFQTSSLIVTTKRKAHFQIDGEYQGKTKKVTAEILPAAIQIIMPTV